MARLMSLLGGLRPITYHERRSKQRPRLDVAAKEHGYQKAGKKIYIPNDLEACYIGYVV